MTYRETIRDIIVRVNKHGGWFLTRAGELRRMADPGHCPAHECPVTAGTGVRPTDFYMLLSDGEELGHYDETAARQLASVADKPPTGRRGALLRLRLLDAAGLGPA